MRVCVLFCPTDVTALLMAEYYWRRPSVTMPRLSSYRLPIKWDLPRSRIQHAIGDKELEKLIYNYLRPKARQEAPSSDEGEEYAEYYHLQHFITLINLLGQGGDIIKVGRRSHLMPGQWPSHSRP
jgi:hypothetical protein